MLVDIENVIIDHYHCITHYCRLTLRNNCFRLRSFPNENS